MKPLRAPLNALVNDRMLLPLLLTRRLLQATEAPATRAPEPEGHADKNLSRSSSAAASQPLQLRSCRHRVRHMLPCTRLSLRLLRWHVDSLPVEAVLHLGDRICRGGRGRLPFVKCRGKVRVVAAVRPCMEGVAYHGGKRSERRQLAHAQGMIAANIRSCKNYRIERPRTGTFPQRRRL